MFSLSGLHSNGFNIRRGIGETRLNTSADVSPLGAIDLAIHSRDYHVFGRSKAVTPSVSDGSAAAGSAYVVTDTESNDTASLAQVLTRNYFTPLAHPHVAFPNLPTARIDGNIATPSDQDFFSITLQKGEWLVLDIDGTMGGLDAYLRLYRLDGTWLNWDGNVWIDPGSHTTKDPFLKFEAPVSGTYTFAIQSFKSFDGSASSGSYTAYVSIMSADEARLRSLMVEVPWQTTSLTYGFPTDASQYQNDPPNLPNFETLNPTQRAVVRQALGLVSSVTGLTFTEESANPGNAVLRYALSDVTDLAYGAYPGPAPSAGDSMYNNSKGLFDEPRVGNYAHFTFMHETGHAVGLKHGHESTIPQDSMEFTVMSYRSYVGAPTGHRNETWGFPQTLMMYDIAALQYTYGANYATRAGDTYYSWNPASGAFLVDGVEQWVPGANRVFMTVWDGGGQDTYDLSNYSTSVTIDLRPGEWSKTSQAQLANLGDGYYARGNVANALLHQNDERSLIENAIGGAGADSLTGNSGRNRLSGGGGADTINGGAGSDWLLGDEGGDIFVFTSLLDSVLPSVTAEGKKIASDYLADFTPGVDRIDLSAIDAISSTEANDSFTFLGTGAFQGVAGQLRFEVLHGQLWLYGDTTGDGIADFSIAMRAATIGAGDLIL